MGNSNEQLKKFIKLMNGKESESPLMNMSRKELSDYNLSHEKSKRIVIQSVDVGDIIKYCRKLKRVKGLRYFKKDLKRPDLTSTRYDALKPFEGSTRDFTTPENDVPLMELKRLQIEQGFDRRVTIRRPQNKIRDTPLAAASTETPLNHQLKLRPRKFARLVNEIDDSVERSAMPIHIAFDDLCTDDEDDSFYSEHLYPEWTKDRTILAENQERNVDLISPLIDSFFPQPHVDSAYLAGQLFPFSHSRIKRRRSSIMWE